MLSNKAQMIGKAWGHSWFGYQSRVYYQGLEPPLPGANLLILAVSGVNVRWLCRMHHRRWHFPS
jgi:hypothetical protein